MDEGNVSGVELNFSGYGKSLNPGIIHAVYELIASTTGKEDSDIDFYFIAEKKEEEVDPGQLAVALAYTHLCLDEPEMVTSRHLKMLRRNFSFEQIHELNTFIRKMIE